MISIRRAVADDAATIAGVLHKAFVAYESSYTAGGFAATTPAADVIGARLAEGPVWVALDDGVVVGTVSAVPRPGAVYLRSMAVLPAARGHGVAGALLHEVEGFARECGAPDLLLSTTPFLTEALRFYADAGFHPSAAGPHDLHGTPLVTLIKRLPAPAP